MLSYMYIYIKNPNTSFFSRAPTQALFFPSLCMCVSMRGRGRRGEREPSAEHATDRQTNKHPDCHRCRRRRHRHDRVARLLPADIRRTRSDEEKNDDIGTLDYRPFVYSAHSHPHSRGLESTWRDRVDNLPDHGRSDHRRCWEKRERERYEDKDSIASSANPIHDRRPTWV